MRYTEEEFGLKKIYVGETFPLFFYRKCRSCDCYIKKEKMWRSVYYDDCWGEFEIMYLCTECCATPSEVKSYIKDYEDL